MDKSEERKKEKTWQLYRECKSFLETNERSWKVRRMERENEKRKLERLEIAGAKKEKVKEKAKIRKLRKEIEDKGGMLPDNVKSQLDREEK